MEAGAAGVLPGDPAGRPVPPLRHRLRGAAADARESPAGTTAATTTTTATTTATATATAITCPWLYGRRPHVTYLIGALLAQVGTGDLAYDAGDIADEMAFVTRGSVRILVDEGSRDTFVGTSSQGGYVTSHHPTSTHFHLRCCSLAPVFTQRR